MASGINRSEFLRDLLKNNPNITYDNMMSEWKNLELGSKIDAPSKSLFQKIKYRIRSDEAKTTRKKKSAKTRVTAAITMETDSLSTLYESMENQLEELIFQARSNSLTDKDVIETLRNARRLVGYKMFLREVKKK